MKTKSPLLLVLLVIIPMATLAGQPSDKVGVVTSTEPGKVARQVNAQVTATVESVDPATRAVTLKGPDEALQTVIADDEVKNFDQIKVGDRVVVRYSLGLVLELIKGGGGIRTRVERESADRAATGEKPKGSAVREVLIVADVVKVDTEKQTVTLRGPQKTVELQVRDPEQLKIIAVGDQVEATVTEATAISVQAAPEGK